MALNYLKIRAYSLRVGDTYSRTRGDTRALGDARRRILCKQSVASAERPRKRQEWWQAVKHLREAVRFFCKAVKFLREAATFLAYGVKHCRPNKNDIFETNLNNYYNFVHEFE